MWYRYKNQCEGSKYLVSETERTKYHHLNKRTELMKANKSKRGMENNETSGATEDSQKMQKEDYSGMPFEREKTVVDEGWR